MIEVVREEVANEWLNGSLRGSVMEQDSNRRLEP